ncbi:MAG: metallophosphoesterase [Bacteroidales bacterium]|nr:metallophosphoesterase [Bacteroidales bacterium]
MRHMQFIIFFSIVLIVYAGLNYYIYARGMQAIPIQSSWQTAVKVVFWLLVASYIIGRFGERFWLSPLTQIFTRIGSFWLAAMLYFFLIILLIDIIRLIHVIAPIYPDFIARNMVQTKAYLFYGSIALVALILIGGHINAIRPKVKELNISIDKETGKRSSLNIVMASDIHLGTVVGCNRLTRIVKQINDLKPDIVLLAGDIVDEDIAPVIKENMGEGLERIEAPLGVYGITGNHEYIGGVDEAVNYLEKHGVNMLRDEVIKVDSSFYLAGRSDKDKSRFSGEKRKDLDQLLNDVNHSFPIILMDHQPFHLDKAQQAGVDLQLSGHTHHGQMWPLNYITSAIYEVSRGYKQKGDSHFYVSSGVGGWGPPVRTNSVPEIVKIKVEFGD